MTEPAESSPAGALGMLQRRLSSGAGTTGETDPESESAGETMNLDMKVTALPDGGLSMTTAGKTVPPETPSDAHRTNRQLAQEEENILRHRDPDDPGYSDLDQHYEDREPEL